MDKKFFTFIVNIVDNSSADALFDSIFYNNSKIDASAFQCIVVDGKNLLEDYPEIISEKYINKNYNENEYLDAYT